jgi:anti-sigma B factor antagonist
LFERHDGRVRLSRSCWLACEVDTDTAVVRIYGELDVSCEEPFEAMLARSVSAGAPRLVLDLRGATFVDSVGLRILVSLTAQARSDGLDFSIVCNDTGTVRRLLKQTGLDGVLPIVDGLGAVPATDTPV